MQSVAPSGPAGVRPSAARPAGWPGRLARMLAAGAREPLAQFLVLGLLIFVAAHVVQSVREASARRIVVDAAVEQRLVRLHMLQTGATPSDLDLSGLTSDYVRDEALYRTALKMGLDQGDEIIRRRLIQKMEFLLDDGSAPGEPDERTLRAYYRGHPGQFVRPGAVSFSHRYFNPDLGGDAAALARARAALAAGGGSGGDAFPLQSAYAEVDRTAALQVFGQTPIVDALFSQPAGRWVGPIRSGYGWHLLFISGRRADTLPPFGTARADVRTAWLAQAREMARQRRLEHIRAGFQVVRTAGAAPR